MELPSLNLLLVGPFGIGKSYTLRKIASKYRSKVLSSNPSLRELNELVGTRFKSKKEAYNYLIENDNRLILFDDVHESRKDTLSTILKLCKNHRVICASEREIELLRFEFHTIKLKPMEEEEGIRLCYNYVKDKKICYKIYKQSKGIPLLIIRGAEYYNVTGRVKCYFKPAILPQLFKWTIVVAYLLLSARYVARLNNNFQLYYIVSTMAYLLLAFNKVGKRI